MTQFTDSNTDGFTQSDLDVLNAAYEVVMQNAEFEADTHAYSDGILNAWVEGDTVDTLVERFRRNHPSL